MNHYYNRISLFLCFLIVIPAVAGIGIMALWNAILPAACGFAEIGYLTAVGLFFLGQLLTAGFVIGVIALGGCIHMVTHHRHHELHERWHGMSREERREFFMRRWGDGRFDNHRSNDHNENSNNAD